MMKKFLRAYVIFLKRMRCAFKAYIKGITNTFNKKRV